MALRVISRVYLLLPSGSKLSRLVHTSGHAQLWSRSITCTLSGSHGVQKRLLINHQSFSQGPPACGTAQFHTTQSNSLISLRQSRRNYSKDESRDRSRSEGTVTSDTSTAAGSTTAAQGGGAPTKAVSSTERIKVILREYGTVAFVFHISMSLCTLGTCYLLVSNGLDVDKVMAYFNFESSATKKGASTFAISYLLYKMLLPIRATITIASVPVIVRYLRARGWMKGVAKASTK